MCANCRGFFEGAAECRACSFQCRELVTSWNYWWWAIIAQVHNLLQSQWRERRGKVVLLGVPPEVGFALMNYFAWPQPALNKTGPVYRSDHPSWKQGTSAGKKYHFMQYAYDCMEHVKWAFPLHQFYPKTCGKGAVRLVSKGRFNDPRWWGTPVQFKYKWAASRKLGVPTMGVHVFTIDANIGHVGIADGGLGVLGGYLDVLEACACVCGLETVASCV